MIKNILFDFGDIFINLNKRATNSALQKLGVKEKTKELQLICIQYEIGKISTNTFIDFFTSNYGIKSEDFVKAWNAVLLDFPLERLRFIKELSSIKKYRLFLLSNTNSLHINWIQNNWGMDLFNEFKSCFEQFYLSHEIHFRKPNTAIYKYVLQNNNLLPNETLFIDDLKENTEAAFKLGIQIWNLNPKVENVTELFTLKKHLF